jgi:transcriptional regulator with XRE-family HTH domain
MSTRGRPELPAAGRWIRDQRERRGITTQADLARRLGWDKTAVNNYETRGVQVPDERARQLATFFGLDEIEVRRNLGLWVPEDEPARQDPPTDEELRASGLAPETVEDLLAMRRRIDQWVAERNERAIRRAGGIMRVLDDEEKNAG